ncbi:MULTISPECIES: helix-turn-helix domain-containing protein [Ramlibacter]|uniref:helix-turn-helix domain-containing protein n=1 Tax=Ramlibacter TaxID=174951 RepID=UPI0015EE72DC|nr:IclR family transcriptional regulator [Ramlibacter sp. CGMCC 1.13660]
MSSSLGVYPEGADDRSDGGVRVLARGLVLLQAFSPRNQPRSNGDLAELCALPKATVSRITATLTRLGYLDYLPGPAQYRLGYGALALGFGVLSTLDVRVRARAHMQRFAEQNDLLVVLAVRDRLAMVCQEVCRGRGALTIRVGVGSRLALPHSAMGRAWIASLPPAGYEALLRELPPAYDPAALRPHFEEAATEIRASGYCVTVSSLEPDVNSLGTLVDLPQAPGQYVLGCSVPAFRYPPERCRQEIGPRLLELRQAIQDDLAAGLLQGEA